MENQTPVATSPRQQPASFVSIAHLVALLAATAFNIYVLVKQFEGIGEMKRQLITFKDSPDVLRQIADSISTTQWNTVGVGFTIAVLVWAIVRHIAKYVKF